MRAKIKYQNVRFSLLCKLSCPDFIYSQTKETNKRFDDCFYQRIDRSINWFPLFQNIQQIKKKVRELYVHYFKLGYVYFKLYFICMDRTKY